MSCVMQHCAPGQHMQNFCMTCRLRVFGAEAWNSDVSMQLVTQAACRVMVTLWHTASGCKFTSSLGVMQLTVYEAPWGVLQA